MIPSELNLFFANIFYDTDVWRHSMRVAMMVSKVSDDLHFKLATRDRLICAAQFHDIGKVYGDNQDHPEQGYFLFLRMQSDHAVADLIRHHHCHSKEYAKRFNESSNGYPAEVCEILDVISPELQTLQICNEWDSFTIKGKSARHEIEYLIECGKWDRNLANRMIKNL